jgi:hypothetical protein
MNFRIEKKKVTRQEPVDTGLPPHPPPLHHGRYRPPARQLVLTTRTSLLFTQRFTVPNGPPFARGAQTSRLATGEMMTRTAASRGARQPRVKAGCHLVSRAPVSVSMYYIQYSIIVLAPRSREEPRAVGLVRTYLG